MRRCIPVLIVLTLVGFLTTGSGDMASTPKVRATAGGSRGRAPAGYTDPYQMPYLQRNSTGTVDYAPYEGPSLTEEQITPYMPQPPGGEGPVDGGGGGGAYDPTTDPVYQAYIASLDLSQAQQQAETKRRQDLLQAQEGMLLGESGRQGDLQRENISNAAETRGQYNSGARLRDISRQQANQGYRENTIRSNTATGISDLESALANALAQMNLKRQSATQGVFQ